MANTIEVPCGAEILTFGSWEEAKAYFSKPEGTDQAAATAVATEQAVRSEAYDYGVTGQPFCPPPPGGLAAYEEAAWVADFHAGRRDAGLA